MARAWGVEVGTVVIALGMAGVAHAVSFPNSLWIGTDNTSARPVLNTDRTGAELRRVDPPVESTGFAIDLVGNTIYFGNSTSAIIPRNLDTLVPGAPIGIGPPAGIWEDMTFDGSRIWRTDLVNVKKINPATGATEFSFAPGFATMGIAWDGTGLWVSQFASGGLVKRFDSAGIPTGEQFNVGNFVAGGLAFDPTDNTLWIGTFGQIHHFTTTGTDLGFFNVPVADGRFVDGLEFQGALASVPEPPALMLLLAGAAVTVSAIRARDRRG